MRLSLEISGAWLAGKITSPANQVLLDQTGLHSPRLLISDTGISLSVRHGGGMLAQRVKVKVGVSAENGNLHLDLRDAKLAGLSIGGNWLEKLLPKMSLPAGFQLSRETGSISISNPGLQFMAAGVQGGNIVLIVEV